MTDAALDHLPTDEAPRRLAGQNRIRLMGLCFGAIATLTLELSEPQDQGINSAALQVCDTLLTATSASSG